MSILWFILLERLFCSVVVCFKICLFPGIGGTYFHLQIETKQEGEGGKVNNKQEDIQTGST